MIKIEAKLLVFKSAAVYKMYVCVRCCIVGRPAAFLPRLHDRRRALEYYFVSVIEPAAQHAIRASAQLRGCLCPTVRSPSSPILRPIRDCALAVRVARKLRVHGPHVAGVARAHQSPVSSLYLHLDALAAAHCSSGPVQDLSPGLCAR